MAKAVVAVAVAVVGKSREVVAVVAVAGKSREVVVHYPY